MKIKRRKVWTVRWMFQRFLSRLLQCRLYRISPQGILRESTTLERHRLYSPYAAFIRRCISRPPPTLKIKSLLVIPSYSPACSVVDDSLCDHLLFGVKPQCR
ncbi:hypothetical protein TNCV_1521531 [Trichonephila clavipes]|nr:hypothetical protein TNCV_1521531 [Trichonephila clavipes]